MAIKYPVVLSNLK